MKRVLFLLALVLLAVGRLGPAYADDVIIGSAGDPYELTTLNVVEFIHDDQDPWKGWAMFYLYNDTEEYWTDFHIKIGSVNGSNISATIFIDQAPYQPTSSQAFTYAINNDPLGATFDFYFQNDQVAPGSTAWFKVYTDNTTYKQKFKLCVNPTVPEPSSLLALSGSILGLAGLAWRKRG